MRSARQLPARLVTALFLLATAVYELAGPKAAGITAWVLAFEPSSIFFSSILHKERSST